jgi:hypothetical protein
MTAIKPKRTAEAHRVLQKHVERADQKDDEQHPMQAATSRAR